MSEQSYPGTGSTGEAADSAGEYSVPTTVDGELLDPAPRSADHDVEALDDAVIEGEAVDLEDLEDLDQGDQADEFQENQDADEGDADESGSNADGTNGNGVLVLDSWQIAIPATGDATVDAALARLADVEGLPPSQHADVYEAVHAGLHEALADLDRS